MANSSIRRPTLPLVDIHKSKLMVSVSLFTVRHVLVLYYLYSKCRVGRQVLLLIFLYRDEPANEPDTATESSSCHVS